ncbi:MAG: TM2 domain-containing protein [Ruminococcaceae bacterium]|nr:TM2 domain-containing protein [Oscillospiraceae bacterium]
MICPNCGKEIAEGEVCSCMQNTEMPVNEAVAPEAEPDQAGYYNGADQGYYEQPAPVYAPPAPVYMPARTDYPEGYKIKKKYVAIILAYTLGVYGIHNFYLGEKTKGLIQVLLSTVGAILTLGLSFFAVQIWVIVEMVTLFTESTDRDANGFKIMTMEEAIAREIKK